MTSQFKTGQLNAYGDLDEFAATRSERDQLRARIALLESNYADLRQAARDEIQLKEQEIEKLRTFGVYRILRRVIGKLISLLRRIAKKLRYFARSVRKDQFSRRPARFELPQKIFEIVANWRGYRAEGSDPPESLRLE